MALDVNKDFGVISIKMVAQVVGMVSPILESLQNEGK